MALTGDTATPAQRGKPAPALKPNFLSHGTLESRDVAFSCRFYEEFFGLEVIQTSPMSLLIRLGGPNTIAVVYSKNVGGMNLLNCNGPDVCTSDEVDEAHRIDQEGKGHLDGNFKRSGKYRRPMDLGDADDGIFERVHIAAGDRPKAVHDLRR